MFLKCKPTKNIRKNNNKNSLKSEIPWVYIAGFIFLKNRMWKHKISYLFICRWCWVTMFFSWIVSSRAVARDLRSEMDWGVTGKLQPLSSDSNSSFTAHRSLRTWGQKTLFFDTIRTYNSQKPVPLTLFGREYSSQCTTVGFSTDFRIFPTLQGTLKPLESIILQRFCRWEKI